MRQGEQNRPAWMNNELFDESAPMCVIIIRLTDFLVTVHVFCLINSTITENLLGIFSAVLRNRSHVASR